MNSLNLVKYLTIILMLTGIICFFPKDTIAAECSGSTICGQSCDYGGGTYNTVLIGSQCWFKKNLNVGNITTVFEVPDNNAPISNNPDSVQKWCFNDDPTSCTNEGGLYSWAEANGLPHSCSSSPCNIPVPNQGICPASWHVPTDAEFYTLENFLTDPGQTCDALRSSWDCYGAGTRLSLGGSSGFDAIRAGDHETNGLLSLYDKREPSIHFWSSSPCLNCANWSHAFGRSLINGGNDPYVARGWGSMLHGISVRCLADNVIIDTDNDEVNDNIDNCPGISNPDQANYDQDGQGDVCDSDDDNDGVIDEVDCAPINSDVMVLKDSKACQLWTSGVKGKGILNALGLNKN